MRLMIGQEHLKGQVYPVEVLDGLEAESRHLMVDLAGNAFSGASYMAALIALLGNLPDGVAVNLDYMPDQTTGDTDVLKTVAAATEGLYSTCSLADDDGEVDMSQ